MSDLRTAILEKIKIGGVSFVELSRIEGFNGDRAYVSGEFETVVFWPGVSVEAAEILIQACEDGLCHMRPTTVFVYAIDGMTLTLPIAKTLRAYQTVRWLPVVFDPGPAPKGKNRNRSAGRGV